MKSTYTVKPILWLQTIDKQMGDMMERQFKRIKRKFEILIWFIILHKRKEMIQIQMKACKGWNGVKWGWGEG